MGASLIGLPRVQKFYPDIYEMRLANLDADSRALLEKRLREKAHQLDVRRKIWREVDWYVAEDFEARPNPFSMADAAASGPCRAKEAGALS